MLAAPETSKVPSNYTINYDLDIDSIITKLLETKGGKQVWTKSFA